MSINITRVYTRGGDKGKTSLVGGVRIDKASRKLDSYGTVDELNCLVGVARAAIEADPALSGKVREELDAALRVIQNRLFDVGSILATPADKPFQGMPEILDAHATELETQMDAMQESLEPLKSFCLPGGTAANAALHHCRAVCRRAERDILRLAADEAVDPRLIKYVNRLSDLFFVMSRYAARKAGVPEYLWEFGLSSRRAPRASARAGETSTGGRDAEAGGIGKAGAGRVADAPKAGAAEVAVRKKAKDEAHPKTQGGASAGRRKSRR